MSDDPFEEADATLRVLVVEDEPRLREMLLHALPDMGFVGEGARSGEEAVKLMEQKPFKVIILDLNLPGMSGLEFCRIAREKWPASQVVILTGFGDLESARQAIRLDVADFLTKPCPLGDLEAALERARRRIREPVKPAKPALAAIENTGEGNEDSQESPEQKRQSTTLAEIERDHILASLKRNSGNRNATAAELGISVRTLYYRLAEYEKAGYEV
jgi:DNA-binding NtrC family response regulator